MTTPPLDTERQAMELPAVRAVWKAYRDGSATTAEGNAAALRRALEGTELGTFDEHVIGWLAGWEPHVITGVLCSLIERKAGAARAEAVKLLEAALFLRANGERPPGAPRDDPEAETWRQWDRDCEAFLRSLLPPG